jgi:hypothetical protein
VKADIHLMFFLGGGGEGANFSHKKADFRDQGVIFGILGVLSAGLTAYSARNWNKALLAAPHTIFSTAWHREFYPSRFQIKASFNEEKQISN